MLKVALTVLVTLALSAAVPAVAAGAPINECGRYAPGGGAGVYNITTRVTGCSTARAMARNFYRGRWSNIPRRDGERFRRGPYSCRFLSQGYELSDLRCTASGGRVVRWQSGA